MLQRFALPRAAAEPAESEAGEVCEFCFAPLDPHHRHLLEIADQHIICACDSCALRFENVITGRFKLIPRDIRVLPDFHVSDLQWENLALPINLVFIFHSSLQRRPMAIYPGPIGATETPLALDDWQGITAGNPGVETFKPDVEALLINRIGEIPCYFRAPIDVCYELAALVRKNWRGFSGGSQVWLEIETFFARLHEQTARFAPQNSLANLFA